MSNTTTISSGCEDEWIGAGQQNFFVFGVISACLVLFGGIMSGLQQGMMQLDEIELVGFQKEGTNMQQWMSVWLLPLARRKHFTLVTLLIANAIAMEALPIFLDVLAPKYAAILISVTLVVLFGEIIPQGMCLRYPTELSAHFAWLVYLLMLVLFPIAYPIAKLLDYLLGSDHRHMLNRAGFRELAKHHSKREHNGPLNDDELDIITGALDICDQIVSNIMVPLDSVFMLDYDEMLYDCRLIDILNSGFSRIPVYSKTKCNLVGFIIVKQLVRVQVPVKVSNLTMKCILPVSSDAKVYELLRLFRNQATHMAVVKSNSEKSSIGIVTLEDVLECLMNKDIKDETDGWVPANTSLDAKIDKLRSMRMKFASMMHTVTITETNPLLPQEKSTDYETL